MPAPARVFAGSLGIYVLLGVVLVFALALVPGFAATNNLANVVTQSAALGMVAIGQTFVIIGGLIDLSVGQLLGLSVVVGAVMTSAPAPVANAEATSKLRTNFFTTELRPRGRGTRANGIHCEPGEAIITRDFAKGNAFVVGTPKSPR